MILLDTLYVFCPIVSSIVAGVVYLVKLNRSVRQLPEKWQASTPLKQYKLGILLLIGYLSNHFFCESLIHYLARNHLYNSFVFTISYTISTPMMFGFLWIHTRTIWKRYAYILLYASLITYFINGGFFHPKCVFTGTYTILIFSVYFLGALLLFTDLLIYPKTENFKFQLKVCVLVLIYNLLATIITSSISFDLGKGLKGYMVIFYLHLSVIAFFYLGMAYIFLLELLKLRRG